MQKAFSFKKQIFHWDFFFEFQIQYFFSVSSPFSSLILRPPQGRSNSLPPRQGRGAGVGAPGKGRLFRPTYSQEYRNAGSFIAIFEKNRDGKWLGEAQQLVNEIYQREP